MIEAVHTKMTRGKKTYTFPEEFVQELKAIIGEWFRYGFTYTTLSHSTVWEVKLCENISQFDSAKCIHIFLKGIREKETQVLRPFNNWPIAFFIKCKSDYLLWNGGSNLYIETWEKEINTVLWSSFTLKCNL